MLTDEKRTAITAIQAIALAVVLEARRKQVWWIGVEALPTPPGYRFTMTGPFRRGAAVHRHGAHPNTQTAQRLLENLAARKGAPFNREELQDYLAEVAASESGTVVEKPDGI